MITWGGSHITREFGAPSIRDMAVQSMRIVRFAGAFEKYFWPIGLHSLLVADIAEAAGYYSIEHHLLLHDVASECTMCDIPRPMKTDEQKRLERTLMLRTYRSLGLTPPTSKQEKKIHEFDMRACNTEGAMGCGPRGYMQTQIDPYVYDSDRDILGGYLKLLPDYDDLFNPNGQFSLDLECRLRRSIRFAKLKENK